MPHPSLAAVRLQLSQDFDLANGDEVSRIDEGVLFRPLLLAEHAIVGSLRESSDASLDRRINTKFNDPLG